MNASLSLPIADNFLSAKTQTSTSVAPITIANNLHKKGKIIFKYFIFTNTNINPTITQHQFLIDFCILIHLICKTL